MFLFFYNSLLYLFSPFILLIMLYRVLVGKEDKFRYFEKFGFSNKKRRFKRKVVWFHACSVGEVKSIFNLTEEFSKKKIQYFNYDKYTFIIGLRKGEFLKQSHSSIFTLRF